MNRANNMAFTLSVAALTAASCAEPSEPAGSPIVVYRNVDGALSDQSQHNLELMKQAAQRQGNITVWVNFAMEFEGNPDLRTLAVIEAEELVKRDIVEQAISPLEQLGEAELLETPEGLQGAPGALVNATKAGLDGLLQHRQVKHVSYFP